MQGKADSKKFIDFPFIANWFLCLFAVSVFWEVESLHVGGFGLMHAHNLLFWLFILSFWGGVVGAPLVFLLGFSISGRAG